MLLSVGSVPVTYGHPKPLGQVQQFPRDFPHYTRLSFKCQEEMIGFSWSLLRLNPGPVCPSQKLLVNHHQYLFAPAEPGQRVPLASPLTSLPLHPSTQLTHLCGQEAEPG